VCDPVAAFTSVLEVIVFISMRLRTRGGMFTYPIVLHVSVFDGLRWCDVCDLADLRLAGDCRLDPTSALMVRPLDQILERVDGINASIRPRGKMLCICEPHVIPVSMDASRYAPF
jgi:hypothetical protein